MGHTGMVTRAAARARRLLPRVLVELGTGDGTFLLRVARRVSAPKRGMRAMLVDRRPSVSAATREGFKAAGWDIDICESDVFEWLCRPHAETADVTIANLFLHHFREGELATPAESRRAADEHDSSPASRGDRAPRSPARRCCR